MTALALLYVKRPSELFGADMDASDRVKKLCNVLIGSGPFAEHKKRLLRVTEDGHDKGFDAPVVVGAVDVQAGIIKFYATYPAWAPHADPAATQSTVFFRDTVPGSDVYRIQMSGNSFMHAPDVVLHYVVCKNNLVDGYLADDSKLKEMVDLTAYVLKHFNGDQLWNLLYKVGGDDSVWFLSFVGGLNSGDIVNVVARSTTPEAVVKRFDDYGPALIAHFGSFDAFEACQAHSFVGARGDKRTGGHAMALVGHRVADDETILFLIQNLWPGMQYFECDLMFLQSRGALLVWVTSPLAVLPANTPLTHKAVGECRLPQGGDRVQPERHRAVSAVVSHSSCEASLTSVVVSH